MEPAAAEPQAAAEHAAGTGEGEGHVSRGVEIGLMVLSLAIALTGLSLAYRFYVQRPEISEGLATRFAGAHRVLSNKYYVDELYDAAVVQPIKRTSEGVLWKGVDAGVIDGAVNGAGTFVSGASSVLRRLQTGSVRAYAVSLVLGVVAVLGYYLWRFVALVAQQGV